MALGLKPVEIVEKKNYPLLVISSHWGRVFLKSLADVQNGFAFSSKLFTQNKGMPLIRIRDISNNKTENYYDGEYDQDAIVNKGDILIGMDGDFNVSIWNGKPGLLNQRVCRIKMKSEKYSEKFLFICLQPYLNAINAETSSVTVKHLSSRTVEDIPLPLPPLPEQHQIVAKIEELFSELDNGIESLKKASEQLKTYRQAVLKYAFEGKLTKEWRTRQIQAGNPSEPAGKLLERIRKEREKYYKKQLEDWETACEQAKANGKKKPIKPKKPKELPPLTDKELAELPELTEEWCFLRLGDSIEEPKYGTSKKCTYDFKEKAVLRIPNIGNGFIDRNDLKYSDFNEKEIQSYNLKEGDLLTIRSNGSISLVGKCACISNADKNFLFAGYLIRIRPYLSLLNSKFLLYGLSSISLRNQIESKAKSTSGVNNINSNELKNLIIPYCCMGEQQQIVQEIESRLSVCDKLEQTIEDSLKKAEALRQSILKKAFEGELTRDWREKHPELISGENSAEKLLEKIKAEKALAANRKKPRSRKTKKK